MAMLMEYESSGNMPLSSWADGNVDEYESSGNMSLSSWADGNVDEI